MDLTTHKFKDTLQQFNNLDKSIPYTKSAETIRLEQELHEAIFARIKEENVEELTCEVSPAVDASNWQSSGALRENEYTLPTSEKPDDSAAVTSMLPSELLSPHFLALNFGPQPTPTTLGELCGRIETGKWGLTSVISHYMMFPCSFCDNVYTRPEYLGRHNCRRSKMSKAKSRRKRPVEFIFNESEPSNSVIRPDRFSCEKPFSCPLCGKKFGRSSTLAKHKASHKEIRYNCLECPEKFKTSVDLIKHIRSAHK
uniref:C2H2-type domain-containing protein n=1 Tax=Timema monikensis TaxID=170555 RepID=A0A7R9HTD8_9NEOP|nr:unnamed protein product [Timema monikensis]